MITKRSQLHREHCVRCKHRLSKILNGDECRLLQIVDIRELQSPRKTELDLECPMAKVTATIVWEGIFNDKEDFI